jgi:hypothetical protein
MRDEKQSLSIAAVACDSGKYCVDEKKGPKFWILTRYLLALLGAAGLIPAVGVRKAFALVLTHISAVDGAGTEEIIFTNVGVRQYLLYRLAQT